MAYLDHNATTPMAAEAKAAVAAAMDMPGNASAQHAHGRAASKLVNDARSAVSLAMGVCRDDLYFTSSGTEADNMAVFSAWKAGCRTLLFSHADHPATYRAAEQWGCPHEFIPVDRSGVTDIDWLRDRLESQEARGGRVFVSCAAANSETGVIQPVEAIADLVKEYDGLLLVDAVQALGKLPMTYMADYLSVSAHKMGGPKGVGALYAAPDAPLESLLCGGGQEKRKRAGTLNTPGIAGFGAAAEVLGDLEHTRALRDELERELQALEPKVVILGKDAPRLPNTSLFGLPGVSSQTLMMGLDLAGVSVSTGTACSSGAVGASRAAEVMGLGDTLDKGVLRVSFGRTSTQDDLDAFLTAWRKVRRISKEIAA